jgi:hypothetical protein
MENPILCCLKDICYKCIIISLLMEQYCPHWRFLYNFRILVHVITSCIEHSLLACLILKLEALRFL